MGGCDVSRFLEGKKGEWAMIIEWKRGKDSWSGSRTARGTWPSTYVIVLVIPST